MTDLSVLIPARNEVYLQKTIDSVLAAIEADTEIIVVLDGCWPPEPIPDNPRVVLIHHTEPRGQRQSINEAARIAKGRFIMKLDAHCSVDQGFDRKLIEPYLTGELTEADTSVPRMYNLSVDDWTPKLHKRTDYMYLTVNEKGELRAEYYSRQPDTDKELDETMACMGPMWLLSRERFWQQGGCDEEHGSWGAQSVEVSLKAWLSGGRLMVNKRTWAAHWFRGDVGFPYPISGNQVAHARNYSKDLWLNDRWPLATRKLSWLVEKFNPPGWEQKLDVGKQLEINSQMYQHIHRDSFEPTYRGTRIIKMPTDLSLYHEVIWANKPKWIIETGTKHGGSALYFQDQLDLIGEGGRVVTIDIKPDVKAEDPRITYITANSIDRDVVQRVREMVGDDSCMVVLDSNHERKHVKWELVLYSPMVTPGQYLVVEDCYSRSSNLYKPGQARDWFLATRQGRQFEQTNLDRKFLVGVCLGGWLRRK